ncbi:hypothetical protein DERP_004752 [Dermatophagoides pteronyssinus]|uniref:Y+L amino acid transporter 2-like n=1 Tax=Dermatophagoides pteronyssinus TaxID=6956 RepID=A0ABQ8JPN4_DERPT|nr:hypothetical protein DERP_004752 [Dermatophagoides pteronyssinus]
MKDMSQQQQQVKFQRQIGLLNGVCFVVGTIIGSGIFIAPKGVFQYANCSYFNAIIVWIICGLYSMVGALCYSELGTTILRSGGDYAYIKSGFGSMLSFVYLWLNVIILKPAAQAIISLTFAYYLIGTFTATNDNNETNHQCRLDASSNKQQIEISSRIIAALTISLLALINCINIKWAISMQNIFTYLKVLALSAIIVSGIAIYIFDKFQLESISDSTNSSSLSLSKINSLWNEQQNDGKQFESDKCLPMYSLAIYSGLFAFGGWNYLNIVTDELKNPYKNLPQAAMAGILISTLIYVLANLSYFLILTPNEILARDAIALTFGRKIIGPIGNSLISFSIAISTLGSLNATIFTTSRLFCIAAQEKHLPSMIGMLHYERYTPIVSLIFSVLITIIMFVGQDIFSLINYFSFTNWLWTGVAVLSGIVLRHNCKDMDRPIRLPLWLLYLFVVSCLFLTILAVHNDFQNSLIGFALMLSGIPVYFLKNFLEKEQFNLGNYVILLINLQH